MQSFSAMAKMKWENDTECDHIDCDGPRHWEMQWKHPESDGITEVTRECGVHALDSAYVPGIGRPVSIRAL